MYRAYLDNELFFSTATADTSLKLLSADLSLAAGKSGSFTFTVPPDNVAFNQFNKFTSYVDVYRDTDMIFSGRVLDDGQNFETTQVITCEGLLSILNDSVFRPINYNGTLQDLVEAMIDSHNSQMSADKQITIGTITIEDEYVYRPYETIETTYSRLSDLVESYGGFLQLNKMQGELYLNWLAEPIGTNTQTVDFGENILDITQESAGSGMISILVPLGAEKENDDGTQSRTNITSVNGGLDYLINAEAMTAIGPVVGVEIWDDVTQPSILKSKGQAYLNNVSRNRMTISLTVADLSDVDPTIEHFTIGQKVIVNSAPHGIAAQEFVIQERNLNLLDPSTNHMTLGKEQVGYISRTARQLSDNVKRIDHISSDYVTNDKIAAINQVMESYESEIRQTSELIASMVSQITQINNELTSQATRINQTANQVAVFIDANGETLNYFILDSRGLWIGNPADPIRLLETNSSIQFIDSSGNNILLEINTSGIITPTVSATNQVALLNGSVGEWAIRKGDLINSKHNLDFVYIG